ncbi:hypothetical protein [Salininema proteolyticum]|uniref:Uncharacterized protein n=1 Tax=Salininema proteolyticum TaxID=1607685 RepID=A0ABV8TYN8_9ACTN
MSNPYAQSVPPPAASATRPQSDGPRLLVLAGISAWALLLVVAGIATATTAAVPIMGGEAPDWFLWAFSGTGVAGMILTMGSFATARLKAAPWLFLLGATLTLVVASFLVKNA